MGLLDDVLNGGLDRDLDGDIDNRDRDLYIEECVINEEKEKQSEDFEYDYPVITYGSSVQSEKERIIRGRPAYSGFKGKDEKLIVEWEKMTNDNADKAKKWSVFYLIGFGIAFLGVLLMIVLPFALYSELDSISPFVISGLIILLIITLIPIIKIGCFWGMYHILAIILQPIADKRIVECVYGVARGCDLYLKIILYAMLLFFVLISMVTMATSFVF